MFDMLERPSSMCSACGDVAVGQWQRRATDIELTAEQERVLAWRQACIDDGRVQPDHAFGPLPGPTDMVVAVFGCAQHAITVDLAGQVHAATCPAPHPDHLPACGCTPEPSPTPEPLPEFVTLATGWTIPARSTP